MWMRHSLASGVSGVAAGAGWRQQEARRPGQTEGPPVMLSLPLHFSGSQTSSIVTRFLKYIFHRCSQLEHVFSSVG